jgi:hypothetical protein
MATFPENIACVPTSGYKETMPNAVLYLGGRYVPNDTIVSVNVITKTDADIESFTHWYIHDIEYGAVPFTIELPLFGVTRLWEVVLSSRLDTQLFGVSRTARNITMRLTLLDDISDYI